MDGRRLGQYELLEEIDHGAMGVIFRARQLGLDRIVAIKMIRSGDFAGPQELARFRTEAEAAARLHHPNIVQIYEVGQQDGRPFLSLEFVDGGSLDKKLGGKPLPPHDAAQLLETLARAVAAEAATRPGDDLFEVLAERTATALSRCVGTGRRSASVPGR